MNKIVTLRSIQLTSGNHVACVEGHRYAVGYGSTANEALQEAFESFLFSQFRKGINSKVSKAESINKNGITLLRETRELVSMPC